MLKISFKMRETPLKYLLKDSSEREFLHLLAVPEYGNFFGKCVSLDWPVLILTRSMFNLIQAQVFEQQLPCIELVLILSQAVYVPVQGVSLTLLLQKGGYHA